MTRTHVVTTLAVLMAGQLALAGEKPPPSECTPAAGAPQVVRVRWHAPEGAPLGAAVVALTYPTASLLVPGRGSAIPGDTRVEGPAGAMLAVSDEDGTMRIVLADAKGMEGDVVARVRFRRCENAEAPAPDSLECRVLDASDDHANPLAGVTCSATLE